MSFFRSDIECSIVFVHGLNGHREKTWTHRETQNFWPQCFLQFRFQKARILSFGYNANVFGDGRGTTGVFASSLLNELRSFREDEEQEGEEETEDDEGYDGDDDKDADGGEGKLSQRPLIFVAHSLGGLVVKAAILRCLDDSMPAEYKSIERALHGIIFMGTPHLGADVARWPSIFAGFMKVFKSLNQQILEDLRRNSKPLENVNDAFNVYLSGAGRDKKTYCFTEENAHPVLRRKVSRRPEFGFCESRYKPWKRSWMTRQRFCRRAPP